jgi:hypothetical protein
MLFTLATLPVYVYLHAFLGCIYRTPRGFRHPRRLRWKRANSLAVRTDTSFQVGRHGTMVQIPQPPNTIVPFAELNFRDVKILGSLVLRTVLVQITRLRLVLVQLT